ncbi:MAG: GTPase, partial [Chloroflexota bacterium]|nr:GTPase [Chloroflexota bacterium]
SAYHNRGIDGLMDAVLGLLSALPDSYEKREEAGLAIVGRPNVGKSTLLNALLGDERAIVHEAPGTTRDALDARLRWKDKELLLIDTAGVKRRARVEFGIDYYALLRALQAINRCDVALLVIDAAEFITAQDMHIAAYIIEAGKGMVLVVNKWDLVPMAQREEFKRYLEQRIRFMSYVPALYISARLRHNVDKVLPQAWWVWRERQKALPGAEIDMVIKQAVEAHLPPQVGNKQLHIVRAYQDESRPTTFTLEVNDPHLIRFAYQRYLEKQLRRSFGFCGVPLRLAFVKAGAAKRKRARKKAVKT